MKYLKMATNTGSWNEHPLFSSRIVRMDFSICETVEGCSHQTFCFSKYDVEQFKHKTISSLGC